MRTPVPGFGVSEPSVFGSAADPLVVTAAQIAALVAAAREQPNGRARLLLHPDRTDGLHEMLIALPPANCDHPHINDRSGKSFAAIAGQFAVLCFGEDGSRVTPIVLSAGAWPGARMVRLRRPVWHTVVPLAGDTVFLETIGGPFTGNRFADWFPAADAASRGEAVAALRRIAREAAARWPERRATYSKKTYSWSPS